ncbi:NAD(P)-dependent oxidoreductase [Streptomyces hoynatensis]|uniref:SDR family oxidoreductase n=1 Tax=Streptomyces hoynatensis TaxID=1141874 RepID=A0A3A9ZET0_9ACTN|nr:SDR family oxidoreductase [Streptomyces hoynatensis]RKN45776.1 SDR family oxidoreductase [Streptomyces hoynatensis]
MKLTVFGATGGVGHQVVRQALDAGHRVTAVVRDPARLAHPEGPGLDVVTVADVTDAGALAPLLAGRDAVISALGARSNRQAKTEPVAGPALRAILTAMERAGTERLVAVSAAPVGPPGEGADLLTRAVAYPLLHLLLRHSYADLREMERVIAASGARWTVVRPPRLTGRPHTGAYRRVVGGNVPGGRTIGRADVADALLACLGDPATEGKAVGVAA